MSVVYWSTDTKGSNQTAVRSAPTPPIATARQAVRIGRDATRRLYLALVGVAYLTLLITLLANDGPWWAALGFLSLPLVVPAARPVLTRVDGPSLNQALAKTGALLAAFSLTVSAGLVIAA